MSPFEYKSGSNWVTVIIVSVIRFTLRVSGLCHSNRQRWCTQEDGPKYTVSLWSQGSNGQEEVRTGECAHSHIMVPGVMMFLSLPFPTLIKAFLVGHIAFRTIDAMLRRFMYTNDPSCYGTVMVLAAILNHLLLCCFISVSARGPK